MPPSRESFYFWKRDLGARLRQHRTCLGRSQTEVAAAAGLSVRRLDDIEAGRGHLTLRVLHGIICVLDVRPDTLPGTLAAWPEAAATDPEALHREFLDVASRIRTPSLRYRMYAITAILAGDAAGELPGELPGELDIVSS